MSIGEKESCGIVPEGASCVSAKDVYLMTNHRSHLENMSAEEMAALREKATGNAGLVQTAGTGKPTLSEFFGFSGQVVEQAPNVQPRANEPLVDTYVAASADGIKNARELQLQNMLRDEQSIQRTEAKMLRLQFAKWEDGNGRLHDPGKIYVEIEGRRWVTGRQQVINPKIITPLEVRRAVDRKTESLQGN